MLIDRESAIFTDNVDELEQQANKLQLPLICNQILNSYEDIDNKAQAIRYLLIKYGVCIVNLKYKDDEGRSLQQIVDKIGTAHTHDGAQRAMWDIKLGGSNGKEKLARSHKLDEFILHTDCSYEDVVPNYFGLQVIQHDRFGGGKNLLVDVGTLVQHLSKESLHTLQTKPVKINVPLEFKKDKEYIYSNVIDNNFNARYRREIIDEGSLSREQINALNEFEQAAYDPLLSRSLSLTSNQIILLDNGRFLHARTQIKDNERHLKRIRFFMNMEHQVAAQLGELYEAAV